MKNIILTPILMILGSMSSISAAQPEAAVSLQTPAQAVTEAAEWLQTIPEEDRRYTRFLSLYSTVDHPWPVKFSADDLIELSPLDDFVQVHLYQANQTNMRAAPTAPKRVSPRLFAIDLRDLGWDHAGWEVMSSRTAYFDAAWCGVREMTALMHGTESRYPILDGQQFISLGSQAPFYYHLLFGGVNRVRSKTELFQVLGLDPEFAEHQSQILSVAVADPDTFTVTNHNRRLSLVRGLFDTYISFDTDSNVGEGSVLTQIGHGTGKELKVAGNEYIFRIGSGGFGAFLNDAQGNAVNQVPTKIASDKNHFRIPDVVAPRNCWACHTQGYKAASDSIGEMLADEKISLSTADRDLLVHLQATYRASEFERDIRRKQSDFEDWCFELTGATGEEISRKFRASVIAYEDHPVVISQAARQMGVPEDRATEALLNSESPELLRLAMGRGIARDSWESNFWKAMALTHPQQVSELPVMPNRIYVTKHKVGATTSAVVFEGIHDPEVRTYATAKADQVILDPPLLGRRANYITRAYPIRFKEIPSWIDFDVPSLGGKLRYEVIVR